MNTLNAWLAILMGVMITTPTVHAADPLEEVDVEAEEVMTEGEAAQEVVKMQKDELRQERRQLKELQATARNARVTAMLRKRDANRQLLQAEREYKDITANKNRLNKEMARDTAEMLQMERRLEGRKTQVEKAKGLLSVAKEAAQDKRRKLEEVRTQNRDTDRKIEKLKREIEDAKGEHKRNMRELAEESRKLNHLLKVSQAEKLELDRETKRLKDEYNKAKGKNVELERRLAKQKEVNERTRDHLAWAKEQTKRRQLAGRKISKR